MLTFIQSHLNVRCVLQGRKNSKEEAETVLHRLFRHFLLGDVARGKPRNDSNQWRSIELLGIVPVPFVDWVLNILPRQPE